MESADGRYQYARRDEGELIRHAAVGVALGNAVDAAKHAADYVTATVDDDGVLRALQHYGVL